MWRQLAEIGILGLGFEPEESGQIEIMVVMTEIGRRLAPEPVADRRTDPGRPDRRTRQRRTARAARRGRRGRAAARAWPTPSRGCAASTSCRRARPRTATAGRSPAARIPVLAGDRADVLVVTATLPDGGVGAVPGRRRGDHPPAPTGPSTGSAAPRSNSTDAPAQPLGEGGDASDRIHATLDPLLRRRCAPRPSARWTSRCA